MSIGVSDVIHLNGLIFMLQMDSFNFGKNPNQNPKLKESICNIKISPFK